MIYDQLVWSNWDRPYTGGWCLQFVDRAFGCPIKLPSATAAWNLEVSNGTAVFDYPPQGNEVPIFFEMPTEPNGHIAIFLADGKVASSSLPGEHDHPFVHDSIQALIDFYAKAYPGIRYLGYTKWLAGKEIIRDKMVKKEDLPTSWTKMQSPRNGADIKRTITTEKGKIDFCGKINDKGNPETLFLHWNGKDWK